MSYRIALWLAICFSLVGVSAPLVAEEDQVVEEVIVTASHRESTLMQSPQSISALTGDMLEEMGVTDMKQVFKNIPGLNMVEGAGTGRNKYIVRGVSSQGGDNSYMQSFSAISAPCLSRLSSPPGCCASDGALPSPPRSPSALMSSSSGARSRPESTNR